MSHKQLNRIRNCSLNFLLQVTSLIIYADFIFIDNVYVDLWHFTDLYIFKFLLNRNNFNQEILSALF